MRRARIAEVVSQPSTWNPQASGSGEPFPYIDISSIDPAEKRIVRVANVAPSEAPSRARQLVRSGDVLVSTVRPNLNAVAVVPDDLDGATASTGFAVLRPDTTSVDPQYLYYWVRSPAFVRDMTARATGASYPAVTETAVRDSRMPLLPLTKQRRIAAVLDKADAIRRKRRESLRLLDEFLPSAFLEMFGDPVRNEKGWPTAPLGELITVKSGEFLPAREMDSTGPFPVYGGNGLSGWHSKYLFENPVVVIGRVGFYCGAVHLAPARSWVTDNALYVTAHSDRLQLAYVEWCLRMLNLNRFASQAAQPLISGGRIRAVPMPIPPSDRQTALARFLRVHGMLAARVDKAASESNALFDSLAQRAFRGDL